jgi:hypothetical protein
MQKIDILLSVHSQNQMLFDEEFEGNESDSCHLPTENTNRIRRIFTVISEKR